MSIWLLIVLATAFGGAVLVWHAVSRTKHISEEMLDKYRDMLSDARAEKLKKLAAEAGEGAQEEAPGEPIETEAAPDPPLPEAGP